MSVWSFVPQPRAETRGEAILKKSSLAYSLSSLGRTTCLYNLQRFVAELQVFTKKKDYIKCIFEISVTQASLSLGLDDFVCQLSEIFISWASESPAKIGPAILEISRSKQTDRQKT